LSFSGAKTIEAFWQKRRRDGVESVSFFTDEALATEGFEPTLLQ